MITKKKALMTLDSKSGKVKEIGYNPNVSEKGFCGYFFSGNNQEVLTLVINGIGLSIPSSEALVIMKKIIGQLENAA